MAVIASFDPSLGGKADGLLWLRSNGYKVPDFAVLPATAVAEALPRDGGFRRLVADLQFLSDDFAVESVAAEIRRRITSDQAVQAFAAILRRESLRVDNSQLVAVRSSAGTEDAQSSSSAGQYSTLFAVNDEMSVARALSCVAASYFNKRAITYRRALDIPEGEFNVSVIIQRFANPVLAGVAFSVHPTTGRHVVYISAAPGLGTSVVEGAGQPLVAVWDPKAHGAQIDQSRHSVMLSHRYEQKTNQIVREQIPTDYAREVLGKYVEEIASEVRSMAQQYGRPVDVEWAVADHGPEQGLYFVQVRPVTAGPGFDSHTVTTSRRSGIVRREIF